ncbi:MAG: N-acyl homoserine lactonase family protein [Gemmatimonadaceae bacterium]|nr:N-acyl homoserine lactonase family protein [Gemmatimonadaceae bacterium]
MPDTLRRRTTRLLAGLLLAAPVHAQSPSPSPSPSRAATDAVYAVRYGTLTAFPVASLIAGADTSRRIDGALMVWVITRANGEVWMVDAGFYREKFMTRWKPADYVKPSDAIAALGIRPEQVTDIIVSHVHWDHADGLDLFPKARVWMQQEEFTHHVGDGGTSLDRMLDPVDAPMFWQIKQEGRLRLVQGDAQSLAPGITVYTGGRHTFASQYAVVETPTGRVVLASDNAYLYENLDTHQPIAQTLDKASNLAAQARMHAFAANGGVIVPGHDPAVMTRFPLVKPNVVRIR